MEKHSAEKDTVIYLPEDIVKALILPSPKGFD